MSDELITLSTSHTPQLDAWRLRVNKRFRGKVTVILTRNRRSMISIRRIPGGSTLLRLQFGFEMAPEEVFNDIEEVIAHNRAAPWKRVCAYARAMPVDQYVPSPSQRVPLRTQGEQFDLQALLNEVNETFFDSQLEARITWGNEKPVRRGRRRSRTLQFGVWDETRRLIRVHPGLDDARVPEEFMRYLVYHELCHAAAPPRAGENGHRRIHHPQFRELEHRFPQWQKMERLGKRIFDRITKEREKPKRIRA